LWGRYTQFTRDGRMPDSYDSWRKRAPRLHAMQFDEMLERGLVMIGSAESVAQRIIEHQERLDLFALACVFRFGAMPYDMMTRSMRAFAAQVMPRVAKSARSGGVAARSPWRKVQR